MKPAAIVGGSESAFDEYSQIAFDHSVFVTNDMIACFPGKADHAVTLHAKKLAGWLNQRAYRGYPPIDDVCLNSINAMANNCSNEWSWGGSVGLFAVKRAMELGFIKIVLCGIPMTKDGAHFLRHLPFAYADVFRKTWILHKQIIAPYVRSYSGWTMEEFGYPTKEWLKE